MTKSTTTTTKKSARKTSAPAMARKSSVLASVPFADPAERHAKIELAAYFLAEQRGFAPGHEATDWVAAERLVDAGT